MTASGAGWLILFIGTYKLGESMADTMFKPFLVDAGYREAQIGLWVGTWDALSRSPVRWAEACSRGGMPLLRAVGWCAVAALRALPVAGEWWLTQVDPTPHRILAVTCFEHLFGGALTTAMFAYMMSRVDRQIGATHYTVLAAVRSLGQAPGRLGFPASSPPGPRYSHPLRPSRPSFRSLFSPCSLRSPAAVRAPGRPRPSAAVFEGYFAFGGARSVFGFLTLSDAARPETISILMPSERPVVIRGARTSAARSRPRRRASRPRTAAAPRRSPAPGRGVSSTMSALAL